MPCNRVRFQMEAPALALRSLPTPTHSHTKRGLGPSCLWNPSPAKPSSIHGPITCPLPRTPLGWEVPTPRGSGPGTEACTGPGGGSEHPGSEVKKRVWVPLSTLGRGIARRGPGGLGVGIGAWVARSKGSLAICHPYALPPVAVCVLVYLFRGLPGHPL